MVKMTFRYQRQRACHIDSSFCSKNQSTGTGTGEIRDIFSAKTQSFENTVKLSTVKMTARPIKATSYSGKTKFSAVFQSQV